MSKIFKPYHEIIQKRPKAILVKIDESDLSPIWLPLYRIELDEEKKELGATQKLWDEKELDRQFDKQAAIDEERAYNSEMLLLDSALLTESGKAIRCNVTVRENTSDQGTERTIYVPKSVCEGVEGIGWKAPRWILVKKAEEAAYQWLSHSGKKRVDHLGGIFIEVENGEFYTELMWQDLMRQQDM